MKGTVLALFILWYASTNAQPPVQTIVPLQPVAVGAAFQVQYIVTGTEPVVELQSPAFGKDFRFVSGPNLYKGEALINGKKLPVRNFSFTLIPLRKGRLIVKGATVVFGSGKKQSGDGFVVVSGKLKSDKRPAAPVSDLPRLAPGGGWNKKVGEQIFVKAVASRQRCFVGEPVAALFTIFSRLPAASEIIKNPGFYGFSVSEVPDAAEGRQTVQTYRGTFYNTHVLRHVQLYPAQPGPLLIDKMSVNNTIEYADSASGAPVQTSVLLESNPLTVLVKPLPATTDSAFSGAVGRFAINAYLERKNWKQNSSGKLVVTLSGAGNFVQIAAPEIRWSAGVNAFDPVVAERLQREALPVAGTRTYSYTFTTDSAGKHTIDPIAFTYFDPVLKTYKKVATDSLHFTVQPKQKRLRLPPALRKRLSDPYAYAGFTGVALLLIAGIVLFYKRHQTRKKNAVIISAKNPELDFETRIKAIAPDSADAYRQLQQALMGFLKSLDPELEATKKSMQQTAFKHMEAVQAILDECEAVQYYNAAPSLSFDELKQQALNFMQSAKET